MGKKQTFASDTSQRSITDWIRALLVLLLGLIIAHLGVTLFLLWHLAPILLQYLFRGYPGLQDCLSELCTSLFCVF